MKPNRIVRAWSWLMGAAILSGPMLAGCSSQQASGPAEDIPKESPVLSTKDSMNDFLNSRKAQQSAQRKR